MKQATMVHPGEIEIHDVPAPTPGPGEVLLRVQRIGVCGSDIHVYHGKHPLTGYPVVQGHEFSAVLEAVGLGVTGFKVGSKVTSMPQIVCGECAPCRRGDYHICDKLKVQGFQAPGCAAGVVDHFGQDGRAITGDLYLRTGRPGGTHLRGSPCGGASRKAGRPPGRSVRRRNHWQPGGTSSPLRGCTSAHQRFE